MSGARAVGAVQSAAQSVPADVGEVGEWRIMMKQP